MTPTPYTISFTVGGLFLFEGIALARLRAVGSPWDEGRHAVPAGVFVAWRGARSVKRIRYKVVRRLTDPETAHLAACRKVPLLAEVAREVLDKQLRTFRPEVGVTDFDALINVKVVHTGEITRLTPNSRTRLGRGTFRNPHPAEGRVCAFPFNLDKPDLVTQNDRGGADADHR